MTTKHMPLPWIIGKLEIDGPANAIFRQPQSGSYRAFCVCDSGDDATDEATTAFIAKACNRDHLFDELVECLDMARNAIQWFIDDNGGGDEADYEKLQKFDALLAKVSK